MYNFCRAVVILLLRIIYRVKINGLEKLPEGHYILTSNHTHIFDPLVLLMLTKKQIFFIAKKEIFKNKILKFILDRVGVIPIDRENNDLVAIKRAFKVLRNKDILGVFPEGTRVKNIDISNMKKGASFIALKNQALIVPVHIRASYKPFTKIEVDVYDYIDSKEYVKYEELEAIDRLTSDLFKSIYQ